MLSIRKSPGRIAALALVAASGAAFAGPFAAGPSDGPAHCELQVVRRGGSVELTALAHAAEQLSGEYQLFVSGSGTNIQQGGPFTAAPGYPATLGTVALSTNGAGYDAELEIVVGDQTMSCVQRIGGGI